MHATVSYLHCIHDKTKTVNSPMPVKQDTLHLIFHICAAFMIERTETVNSAIPV